MEIYLISSGIKIGYDHTAIVLDEKVQLPEVFQNQRRRFGKQIHWKEFRI